MMERELTAHRAGGINDEIVIGVFPSETPAPIQYVIFRPFEPGNPAFSVQLNFQNGPPAEVGINGITNESLLAVVEDRSSVGMMCTNRMGIKPSCKCQALGLRPSEHRPSRS